MLIIFLAIFFSANFTYANSNLFYPYVTFPTGSWPEAVAIGDVNGDGRNDVVMTTSFYFDPENDYHIFVFLQNSSGELNPPIKYPTNSSYANGPVSIDIGDVNHDGKADVVVGNSGDNIEIFLQNASGGLDPGVSYPTVNSLSIKIADLNNDGLLDVVGIGWGTDTLDVLLQNLGGTLNPPVTHSVTHGGYDEVDVGDVNNDGLTDIIVMSGQGLSPNLGVLLQQTNGSFSAPIYYELGEDELTQGVAVGDVNGDNLRDVVVTYGGNRPYSKIGVLLQNRTRTLQPAVSFDSYDCPEPVVIADINNDSKKDIIVAHGGWLALGVYLQGTNGSLLPEELYPLPYATHYNPQGLAVGDINGDGLNDVVIADYNHGLVVLYNIGGPAIPNIDVSPSPVSFGSVFVGNSSSQNITIYNRGTGALTISTIEIMGPNAADFGQTNACSEVGPGSTCTINATFIATTEGEKNATLTITSNDPDTPVLQVTFLAYAGRPLFDPYVYFPTGSQPVAVAIGDVNGDGRNDVVMTTTFYFDPENDYHIFVFLQNSSGELNPPTKYPTNSSYTNGSESIDIGDVNHDGRADVVVGNSRSNIEVFLQNAAGRLNPGISYPTVNSTSIKIADLNSDGLLDVVGIGWGTNTLDVLLQNSGGTLNSPATYSVTHGGYDEVDVGDVNNDGLTDIIVMSGQGLSPNFGVLLQQANGTFSGPVYYQLGEDELTQGVAIGDVNGDNLRDVVVTYGGNWPSSKIGVFLQNATGILRPAISYDSYDIPEPVVIADVNNDGRQDVILAHGGWQALGVYLQGTNGSLLPEELYPLPYATHYNPQGLAVGDINDDGRNDVVIADYNYGLVVLRNVYSNASYLTLQSPPDGAIFNSCSLTTKNQPSFTWTASERFASYTVLFSISPTDFTTPGLLITKASVQGSTNSWTPSSFIWKKVMTSSSQNGEIYWKVIGTRPDRTTSESEAWSFSIGPPQLVTINAPAGGLIPGAIPPAFDFDTNCNVKFKLEISSLDNFSDSKKIKSFNYSTRDPNVDQKLTKPLSSFQWNSIKKLIGTGTGYFRIKAWDGINRETASDVRSFSVQE
jgi:hypothetical protein